MSLPVRPPAAGAGRAAGVAGPDPTPLAALPPSSRPLAWLHCCSVGALTWQHRPGLDRVTRPQESLWQSGRRRDDSSPRGGGLSLPGGIVAGVPAQARPGPRRCWPHPPGSPVSSRCVSC